MRKNNCITNFIRCGVTGWCIEIIYTALGALRRRELSLKGVTSLWMFPIYGAVSFFRPLFRRTRRLPLPARGILYALLIWCGEYASGSFLQKKELCPWDYCRHRWHVHGLIRLDFFLYWCAAGLLFEKILTKED